MTDTLTPEHKLLVQRTTKKLEDIPVSGGGYITFQQQTLRSVVSYDLIKEMAEVAVRCALGLSDKTKPPKREYYDSGNYGGYDGTAD